MSEDIFDECDDVFLMDDEPAFKPGDPLLGIVACADGHFRNFTKLVIVQAIEASWLKWKDLRRWKVGVKFFESISDDLDFDPSEESTEFPPSLSDETCAFLWLDLRRQAGETAFSPCDPLSAKERRLYDILTERLAATAAIAKITNQEAH